MKQHRYTHNGFTFERVSKKVARAAFSNGLPIVVCPCNLRPGFPYHPELPIHPDNVGSFDAFLCRFEYYNLRGAATGRYTAFYIPIQYVDGFTGEPTHEGAEGAIKRYDYKYLEA